MGAGKIDRKNLGRDNENRKQRIRFRKLETKDGTVIEMYGYACYLIGPWFGFPIEELVNVPCTHCHQTGVFNGRNWRHHCPGHANGKPCAINSHCNPKDLRKVEDHLCLGAPSMQKAPMWSSEHFNEVPT